MAKDLDIIERQLELGDVKVITTKGGTIIKFIELLFSPITKVQFAPSKDKRTIMFSVMDNNLDFPQFSCNISKETLYDLIISLKNLYNELKDDDERINN